jgi:hypothetical protein
MTAPAATSRQCHDLPVYQVVNAVVRHVAYQHAGEHCLRISLQQHIWLIKSIVVHIFCSVHTCVRHALRLP